MSDYFDVLFNARRPFVPIRISGGTTNGRVIQDSPSVPEQHLEKSERLMYEEDVEDMRRQLKRKLIFAGEQENAEQTSDCPIDDVYKKYNFGHRTQAATQLPVHAFRTEILSTIAKFPSVVIEGSTGCGKTTQVIFVFLVRLFVCFFNFGRLICKCHLVAIF